MAAVSISLVIFPAAYIAYFLLDQKDQEVRRKRNAVHKDERRRK